MAIRFWLVYKTYARHNRAVLCFNFTILILDKLMTSKILNDYTINLSLSVLLSQKKKGIT